MLSLLRRPPRTCQGNQAKMSPFWMAPQADTETQVSSESPYTVHLWGSVVREGVDSGDPNLPIILGL